jgi:hypothetical protein
MTAAEFRRLALRLGETYEGSHMGHPDFRVSGRIFATLGYPRSGFAVVMLSPEDQAFFLGARPDAFAPVKGAWGERGSTTIALRAADAATVRAALRSAWELRSRPRARKAPRRRPGPGRKRNGSG